MFEFLKNVFSQTDNSQLFEAVHNKPFLVDVRTPSEFSMGKVKGSVNIPLNNLPGQLNKFRNKKHIVVFCRSGARSSRAKRILEQNGVENVINGGSLHNVNQALNR